MTRIAIREDLLTGPLDPLSETHLCGSRCGHCGETSLGQSAVCPNCGGGQLQAIALNDGGLLWSFTVVRHKPPGNYQGPEPFRPFGIGLVELPDGLRVMAPLSVPIDRLAIGMSLRFEATVLRVQSDGTEIVGFAYQAATR